MDIIFATNNAHKLTEVQAVLGPGYKLLTPRDCGVTEEIPEEQDTLEGNASQKAHYLHERTGMDCFADDTGLEVEALFDPLFIPDGYDRTFAQMTTGEKNEVSHRARAVRKLAAYLHSVEK